MMRSLRLSTLAFAALVSLSACSYTEDYWFDELRGMTTQQEPIVPIRNMYNGERYDNQGQSAFFADHRQMRPQVAGTVAREMEIDRVIETGRQEDDRGWVLTIPPQVVARSEGAEKLTRRGQERYNVYCAPCHSRSGDGQGIVVRRNSGMPAPPSYHQDRIRHMPDGGIHPLIHRPDPSFHEPRPNEDFT